MRQNKGLAATATAVGVAVPVTVSCESEENNRECLFCQPELGTSLAYSLQTDCDPVIL